MEKRDPRTPAETTAKKQESILSKSCQCSQEKLSIVSIVCRICYDSNKDEPIITPCRCKGTVAFIHRSCLETWLAESNTTSCELCHHVYRTERTPKYTAQQSVWRWFTHQPQNVGFQIRALRSDLFACALLTPLAIIITYVCLFSADYYNQQRFSNIPAARWTSISLLVMISIMIIGYYLWVYMVVRYHGRVWYYWWQRECVVRYVPPSALNIICEHDVANTDRNANNETESGHDTVDALSVHITDENSENRTANNNEDSISVVIEQGQRNNDTVIDLEENEHR